MVTKTAKRPKPKGSSAKGKPKGKNQKGGSSVRGKRKRRNQRGGFVLSHGFVRNDPFTRMADSALNKRGVKFGCDN